MEIHVKIPGRYIGKILKDGNRFYFKSYDNIFLASISGSNIGEVKDRIKKIYENVIFEED